ncbi:hypothetical protein TREMEDRAFT_34383, partial [Tremella mesenterica DSM 1558]|uniref:uncharacterized protein n=1 Tax=Tremella mesenterica (strain ATCC 24925 / CBS 8224 / DSM 1558 / NBRC 9311 / NRRL Y-6157 / RJB 2259-6 / UBC 559-6) TaxID=578456 RepID=UPI0003F498C7
RIGNGAKAKESSMEAKQHQKRQKELDEEASNWIFHENNQSSPPNTIDLHGLYVKEALERVETAISRGQKMKQKELKVIVGKGIHSQGHVAKVKPAVEGLMMKYNLSAHLDPDNPGVLIVHLTGSDGMNPNGNSREIGSFVDNLGEKGNDGCLIM